jgi:hypothetical protein
MRAFRYECEPWPSRPAADVAPSTRRTLSEPGAKMDVFGRRRRQRHTLCRVSASFRLVCRDSAIRRVHGAVPRRKRGMERIAVAQLLGAVNTSQRARDPRDSRDNDCQDE